MTIRDRYEASFMGLQVRQDYRLINLWEVDAAIGFEQSLNVLLPFVPVMKNGADAMVVQQAVNQLRQDEQLVELESLLAFFATFVLNSEVVQPIMRWDMAVLRESPWYQEILREGEQRGEQKGMQRQRSLILKQLTQRVGELSPNAIAQVEALSI